ncbi:MAG: hypothetical protein IM638_08245 [Bacteroidetes bacterium]|nr:hypothetical protein [Bacteroidota bacterium]
MKRIALIGESPNDTKSVAALLSKRYEKYCTFFTMLNNIRGGELDDIKSGSVLIKKVRIEYQIEKPDLVIIIRDLDALENGDIKHRRRRIASYARIRRTLNKNTIHLLSIYEIEALLLADTKPINDKYGVSISYSDDPMLQHDPKGYIQKRCAYIESESPELFEKLDFNKLLKVRFFASFINSLEKKILTT